MPYCVYFKFLGYQIGVFMKKIVAWLTLMATVATICVSLSGITVGAYDASYLKKWKVSEELLSSVSKANRGVPDFSDSVFSYDCKYYDYEGIYATSYNPNATSYIYGITDNNKEHPWKSLLALTKGDSGFEITTASQADMSICFTAPASGKYVFSPEYLGGSYLDKSIYSSNGKLEVAIKKGNDVIWSDVISAGSYSEFEELTVELLMGEKLSVVFNVPGYKSNGYTFASNFSVCLIREDINTIVETPAEYLDLNYNVAKCLDVITSTTATTDYDVSPFGIFSGGIKPSASWVKPVAKVSDGSSWFADYHYRLQDSQYGIYATAETNIVRFVSKNCANLTAFSFTAPETATYSISADSMSASGGKTGVFKILNEDYNEIYSGNGSLNFELYLYQGDKIYFYMYRGTNTSDLNESTLTVNNLNISASVLVSPAIYVDKDYKFQKNADDYIKEAEYLIDDDDFLTVTIGGSSAYVYKMWVQQLMDEKTVWVPLEEIDYGVYALMNAYDIDGVFKFCIMAYDENGIPLTTSYFNHITEVKKEEAGSALITNIFINGTAVEDVVVIDKAKGNFKLECYGVNIDKVECLYEGVRRTFKDSIMITPTTSGNIQLKLTALSSNNDGATDVKSISVYVYDSSVSQSYMDIKDLNVNVDTVNQEVVLNSNATEGSLFSYVLFAHDSKALTNILATDSSSYSFKLNDKMVGYYTVKSGVKSSIYGGDDDRILKNIYIARNGGSWTLNATLDSSSSTTVYGTIGNSYKLDASAIFSGNLGSEKVEYSFYIKDQLGTRTTLDWSETSSWSFTPAYAGRYVLGVAAKGSNALSAEVRKEFYLDVEGETSNGSLTINTGEITRGMPLSITADYSDADNEVVAYRFWIITDGYTEIIQNYSISDNCIWIPKTKGTYTIRVDVINQNSFGMYDVKAEKTVVVK